MIDQTRLLQPMILQTKQELLNALKQGQLKTSKYNLLSEVEKLYVELVCFGGYTGEQAMRVIDPAIRAPLAASNRLLANPDVQDTIDELTVAKDKKFQAEVQSARDMAMAKILYIMNSTNDETLAVSCAKIIMDKAEAASKQNVQKDEAVGAVRFNIQVENVNVGAPIKDEPVIIELTPEEIDPSIAQLESDKQDLQKQVKDLKSKKEKLDPAEVDPNTGLSYTLVYEGIDNYTDEEKD